MRLSLGYSTSTLLSKSKMYFIEIVLNFIFFFTAGLEPGALWMPGKRSTSELHLQLCLLDSEFGSFLSRLVMCNPVLALDVRQIQKAALRVASPLGAKVANTPGRWVTQLGESW